MRWPYDRRADATHAWGALGVGTAGIIGIPTVFATVHATDRNFQWWWPTNWIAMPLAIFTIGLILLLVPIRRSRVESSLLPADEAPGVLAYADYGEPVSTPEAAVGPTGPRAEVGPTEPEAPVGPAEPTAFLKDEMVYDTRLNPIKELLVRYVYRSADISIISSQSGLEQGSIAAGGSAVNYWQEVLERACIEGELKVDAVLDCAIHHLRRTVGEAPLRGAVEKYRQARS